ncbi:hypothetical protein Tco_0227659 [Tanacetum coccineum]
MMKRICLIGDLKEAQDHKLIKHEGTSSKINTSYSQDKDKRLRARTKTFIESGKIADLATSVVMVDLAPFHRYLCDFHFFPWFFYRTRVEVTVQVEPSNAACANRDIYVGMSSGFECADRIVDTAHTKYAHLQEQHLISPKLTVFTTMGVFDSLLSMHKLRINFIGHGEWKQCVPWRGNTTRVVFAAMFAGSWSVKSARILARQHDFMLAAMAGRPSAAISAPNAPNRAKSLKVILANEGYSGSDLKVQFLYLILIVHLSYGKCWK